MSFRHDLMFSLLDLIYPEHCQMCGAAYGTAPWFSRGPCLYGLRPWDSPHLCRDCFTTLQESFPATRVLDIGTGREVPVLAAQWTNPQLVDMVGAWKYKGVRGLVWPLSRLLTQALAGAQLSAQNLLWIPLPLHRRRRRERGFNQAHMLAAQLADVLGGRVDDGMVVRRRTTLQQAKLTSTQDRMANMQDVFALGKAFTGHEYGKSTRIIVVDDLVTSGATAGALVHFLSSRGIQVEAVVCLGLAKADSSGFSSGSSSGSSNG